MFRADGTQTIIDSFTGLKSGVIKFIMNYELRSCVRDRSGKPTAEASVQRLCGEDLQRIARRLAQLADTPKK